jgi:gliding motility-associated-like protein
LSSGGLVLSRNAVDGAEVNYFRITNIKNGTLYKSNGTTAIGAGDFITYAEGQSGLRFLPNASVTTSGSFDVEASVGNNVAGVSAGKATATITINATPTSTGIANVTVAEDAAPIAVNLHQAFADKEDADDKLTYSITGNSNPALFSDVSIAAGVLTLRLAANAHGNSTIRIRSTDTGGAFVEESFTVTVTPVNDAPAFTSTPATGVLEGATYSYTARAVDAEKDPITLKATTIPAWLTFTDNKNGSGLLTGKPDQSLLGNYPIVLRAEDNQGAFTDQSFTITVGNVNDPPVFSSLPATVARELIEYDDVVQVTDKDPNDSVAISIQNWPAGKPAWLLVQQIDRFSARFFGVPPTGAAGKYAFNIVATDRLGSKVSRAFTINVSQKNNPPIINLVRIAMDEDSRYTFMASDFISAYTDADGDALRQIKITALPGNGRLTLENADVVIDQEIEIENIGELSYEPVADFSGGDDFGYTASDGLNYAGGANTVAINVRAVDDAPRLSNMETEPLVFLLADNDLPITGQLEIEEVDAERLKRVEIRFIDNFVQGEDQLRYDVPDSPITGNWIDSLATLRLTGVESDVEYEAALRQVVYHNNNPLAPELNTRLIEITATDVNESVSDPVTREIIFEDSFVELEIPNAFTPYFVDNANDEWEIGKIELYQEVTVAVYDRSGQVVFQSEGYNMPWDGRSNGEPLPGGAYFYVINLEKYQKTYKGTVTILK